MAWTIAPLVSLFLCACGVKSPPVPPDQTKPMQISDLRAANDPYGIDLYWSRPTRYQGGRQMRDLGEFIILRAQGGEDFQPLVELPVTDQERFAPQRSFVYLDGETDVGATYRYEIISRTMDGYASQSSNTVTFRRTAVHPKPQQQRTQSEPTQSPTAPPTQ
jgi:hypothetical protein